MLIYSGTLCKMTTLHEKYKHSLENIQYCEYCITIYTKKSCYNPSQCFLNTMFIISFKFLQATISVSPRSKDDNDVLADLGIIHFLYPSFATVFILLSILGTYKILQREPNRGLLEQGEEEKNVSCARWVSMDKHMIST